MPSGPELDAHVAFAQEVVSAHDVVDARDLVVHVLRAWWRREQRDLVADFVDPEQWRGTDAVQNLPKICDHGSEYGADNRKVFGECAQCDCDCKPRSESSNQTVFRLPAMRPAHEGHLEKSHCRQQIEKEQQPEVQNRSAGPRWEDSLPRCV